MRLFTQFPFFILIIGTAALLLTPHSYAQGQRPVLPVTAKDVIGDVFEAQAEPSTFVPAVEQSSPVQIQSDAGERKQERQEAEHPASGILLDAGIGGTVTDANGDVVPGATVELEGPLAADHRSAISSDSGAFQFGGLRTGVPYRIAIGAKDLESWKSQAIVLDPGQYFLLTSIKLRVPDSVVSVTVYASPEKIATEQVSVETKQRIFGVIPNFYVTYDAHPAPLTTKLKFKLAYKADTDVITFVGVAFMAGIYQAGDIPDYQQGAIGYGQRVGAGVLDTTTDIFIGGAILPWMLRQDPRYFYQGTGTKKSRAFHAISSPYICKGDNGKTQPNFSSLGGDLASGAISNLYYPDSDRGIGLVFKGFMITTGVRTVSALLQEFVLRKLTPTARSMH